MPSQTSLNTHNNTSYCLADSCKHLCSSIGQISVELVHYNKGRHRARSRKTSATNFAILVSKDTV